MKMPSRPHSFRLLLSLVFSALMFALLLLTLSPDMRAAPRMSPTAEPREENRLNQLDYTTPVSVCEQTENLVPNPGFEQGIGCSNHWCDSEEGGNCAFAAQEPGHNGSHLSGRIDSPGNEECMLFTPLDEDEIRVSPDRFYDYSAWIKAALMNEGQAFLRITFWSLQGNPPAWTFEGRALTTPVTDTHGGWTQVTGYVQAPTEAQYARVEAVSSAPGSGSVWFDDVFLGLAICLDISKSDTPDPVVPGQNLTYTIIYSNAGREKASGVQIIETYDNYVTFIKAEPPPDHSNNVWMTDTLEAGRSGTITVVVEVEKNAQGPNWLFNTVEVCSPEALGIRRTITTSIDIPTNTCAINVRPTQDSKSGKPGQSVSYTLELQNAGHYDGQVALIATSSQNWPFRFSPPTSTLSSGDSGIVILALDIPLTSSTAVSDVTFITATLECGKPDKGQATASVTTTVDSKTCAINLRPTRDAQSGKPGQSVSYTLELTNTGQCAGQVTMTATSSQNWPFTFHPPTRTLLISGTDIVTLALDIPLTISTAISDVTFITATLECGECGQGWATANVTTMVDPRICAVNLRPVRDSQSGKPGQSVSYTLEVTNAGQCAGQVALAATSSLDWPFTFSPPTSALPISGTGLVTLTLDIPLAISTAIYDVTSITIALECGECGQGLATASVTTTVVPPVFFPLVLKNYAEFCNGNFETGDTTCWNKYEDANFPVGVVTASTDLGYNCFSTYAVRIGKSGWVPDGEVPIGRFGIAQSVVVSDIPNPKLEFDYCMYSYDVMIGPQTGTIYDSFEITINDPDACPRNIDVPVPDTCLWRTGNPDPYPHLDPNDPWASDSDHRPTPKSIDLSRYRGKPVTIYFLVWNRVRPIRNTWTYIDNIDGDFMFKR